MFSTKRAPPPCSRHARRQVVRRYRLVQHHVIPRSLRRRSRRIRGGDTQPTAAAVQGRVHAVPGEEIRPLVDALLDPAADGSAGARELVVVRLEGCRMGGRIAREQLPLSFARSVVVRALHVPIDADRKLGDGKQRVRIPGAVAVAVRIPVKRGRARSRRRSWSWAWRRRWRRRCWRPCWAGRTPLAKKRHGKSDRHD